MIWRSVVGYEGLYEVSDTGLVRSVPHYVMRSNGRKFFVKETYLKADRQKKGYLRVKLTDKNGVEHFPLIHRLVAEAFIPNPYCKPFVNHIDACTNNNRVENLEWVTNRENLIHASEMGLLVRNSEVRAKMSKAKRKIKEDFGV